jgi:hypothetical protein
MRIDTDVTVITGTQDQIEAELARLRAQRLRLAPPQTSKEEDPRK